jgi:2-phospho-L-lactate transferase/gluconeogenesis factor (CofD/UPF0052 family)
LIEHCGRVLFPTVLVNTRTPSRSILTKYEQENARTVEIDRDRLGNLGLRLVERDLLAEDGAIRHDSDLLAAAVLEAAG